VTPETRFGSVADWDLRFSRQNHRGFCLSIRLVAQGVSAEQRKCGVVWIGAIATGFAISAARYANNRRVKCDAGRDVSPVRSQTRSPRGNSQCFLPQIDAAQVDAKGGRIGTWSTARKDSPSSSGRAVSRATHHSQIQHAAYARSSPIKA